MQKRRPVYSPALLRGRFEALGLTLVAERVEASGPTDGQDPRGWKYLVHLSWTDSSTVLSQVAP
jgi:hypothetical protein